MGYRLSLHNNTYSVTLPADQYSNCYDFTLAAIKELFQNYGANVSAQIRPFYGRLMAADASTTAVFVPNYEDMVTHGNATPFVQAGCAALPAASLVLFMDLGGHLQHSMLVKDADIWIGANNGSSLGALNSDITLFSTMSARVYTHGIAGGWDPTGNMAAIFGGGAHTHNMFSIPIVV